METHGNPWGPMGTHDSSWEPMGTHGDPWEPMGPHGNPWVPMGTHGTHGYPWVPMGPTLGTTPENQRAQPPGIFSIVIVDDYQLIDHLLINLPLTGAPQ